MHDPRWGDDARERESGSRDLSRGGRSGTDSRERERERVEPREVFAGHVNLPRGQEREHVWVREHSHMFRGSESRTLASVGSFRAIPADDLRDAFDKPVDPRHGDLWHLREAGLVQAHRVDRDTTVVTLTKEGCDLLEAHRRDQDAPDRQTFTHGVQRPRELKHDAELYRAYLEGAEHCMMPGQPSTASFSRTSSSPSTKRSCRSRTATATTATDARSAACWRSSPGRTNTTCRVTTRGTSSSRTCASSATSTDATTSSMSRS